MKKDFIKVGIRIVCNISNLDVGPIDMTNKIGTITWVHITQSNMFAVYVKWDDESLNSIDPGILAWAHPNLHFELLECPENDIIIGELKQRQEHADKYL